MKRWLFNLLAAVSLVLCVGAVALWMRSYWVQDLVGQTTANTSHGQTTNRFVRSNNGSVRLVMTVRRYADPHHPNIRATPLHWGAGDSSSKFDMPVPDSDPRLAVGATGQTKGFNFGNFGACKLSYSQTGEYSFEHYQLRLPHWSFVAAFALFPVWWLAKPLGWRRRYRIKRGLCLACGYNLTGNVSGVCPECGTAIPPAAGGGRQAAKEGSA